MSLPLANVKNFNFTLRYPPDKIAGVFEGSFTATATATAGLPFRTNSTVAHGLAKAPLVQLTFSVDGGTSWQDQHGSVPTTSPFLSFDTCPVGCYSTTTDIVIVASNFTTSAVSVLYRAVAIWRDV